MGQKKNQYFENMTCLRSDGPISPSRKCVPENALLIENMNDMTGKMPPVTYLGLIDKDRGEKAARFQFKTDQGTGESFDLYIKDVRKTIVNLTHTMEDMRRKETSGLKEEPSWIYFSHTLETMLKASGDLKMGISVNKELLEPKADAASGGSPRQATTPLQKPNILVM
ncbi:MAG TPA: hypothetical protein PKI93_05785 [Alphaproteobacteria bacterium]|nr:hypothetical protein [Alphaproteobacteria bacterium]HNS44888.1 hypothetical protein [Alphaproteobacteria bacterium]